MCFCPCFGFSQIPKADSTSLKQTPKVKIPVDSSVFKYKYKLPFASDTSINNLGPKKPGFGKVNLQADSAKLSAPIKGTIQSLGRLKVPAVKSPDSSYFKKFNVKALAKTISFHISGFVEGRYSDFKDTLTNMPPSYFRAMLNPTIKIAGIPITGNIFYSTEQGPISDNWKNISFKFDYQQYYNDIYQRIYGQKKDLLQSLNTEQIKSPNLDPNFDQQLSGYQNQMKIPSMPGMPSMPGVPQIPSNLSNIEGDAKSKILSNLDKLEKMPEDKEAHLMDSLTKQAPWKAMQLKQMKQLDSTLHINDKDFQKLIDSLQKTDYSKYLQYKDLKQAQQIKEFKGDDLQSNLPQLEKSGLISKTERTLLNFKKIGVGDNYPMYTQFSLMGMKIRGVDLQYCPKNLIFSFSGGVSPQIRAINMFTIAQDDKNVLAGSFGYGRLNSNYIRVSYVEAREHSGINYDSIMYPPAQTFSRVYTTDFSYALGKKVTIKGELANSNLSDQPLWEYYPSVPIHPNVAFLTKDMNWAGDISVRYNEEKLKFSLTGEVKEIEPNFISYAMPFMRTDYLQYQIKLQKQLLNRQVFIEGYWVKETDNLSGRGSSSSQINSFGGSLGLYFNNLPYLLLSYSPTSMSTQTVLDTFHYQSSFKTYTAQAGYQVSLGTATLLSTVNGFVQEENFTAPGQASFHKMIWAGETVKFRFPLAFSINAGYLNIRYNNQEINSRNLDASAIYNLNKRYTVSFGYSRDIYEPGGDKEVYLGKVDMSIGTKHKISLMLSSVNTVSYLSESKGKYYDISIKYAFKL